jgi:hypothetical protein
LLYAEEEDDDGIDASHGEQFPLILFSIVRHRGVYGRIHACTAKEIEVFLVQNCLTAPFWEGVVCYAVISVARSHFIRVQGHIFCKYCAANRLRVSRHEIIMHARSKR